MLKNFKPVSLILVAGALSFPMGVYADLVPDKPSTAISQQDGKVTGTVEDDFGPVAGASVVVKGTTNGTITDMDGNFTLEGVKKGDIIQISFIGYATQEITYNGEPSLSLKLAEDTQKLDEVVVTALGMKRSTKALGYAMTEMKGEDLATSVVNPVNALQGKVAGVEISQSDGGMFGSSKILIRGASTLGNNNQPIYVVDGVILDNSVKKGSADWDGTSYGDYGNELKNLNPDDFETVSVLKGAAATALYGSRGLNGAVVITTKSGKEGQGLGINVSQTFGIDHMFKQPNLQYEFGNGQYAGNVRYGQTDANGNYYVYDTGGQFYLNSAGQHTLIGATGRHWGPAFDGSSIEYYDGSMVPYSPVKNNMKDVYNLGFNTNTNVSVSGGNDKTTFYTSLSYKYMTGTLPNNSFDRISFMAKATHKLTEKVKLEAAITFANSNPKNAQPSIGEFFVDVNNGPFGNMYDSNKWRNYYKASHGGMANSSYGDEYGRIPGRSLWWNIYENDYSQKETSVRPSLILRWDLLDWLKFTAEGNYNYYYKRAENKQPGSGYANEGGYYGMDQYTKEQTNLNAAFSVDKMVGEDWHFSGFLRGEYYNNIEQAMSGHTNNGLVVRNQYFLDNSKTAATYSGKIQGEKRMLSIAFQAGASWKEQVFVDVTGRNDWSSSLVYSDTHGNYSYFYPSINGSWLIHETFRDQLPEWISFAKIRGSWAQVGNDTEAYRINSAYELMTASSANGNNFYTLSVPTTAYSQNLKPERKNAWEIGLDWRFLKNKIGIDATYYKENTKDQIMYIDVPGVSGINQQLINAGNIQNTGVEIALNTTPFENKDWTWDLNFTYTKNTGKIIELHENVADYVKLIDDAYTNYGNFRIAPVAKVGEKFGALMSDAAPKIDEKSGLPVLATYDFSTGQNGYHAVYYERSGKEEVVGSMQPDFMGSVNTSLRYKNWTLRASMDMRFGGYVASYGSRYGTTYGLTETSLQGRDAEHGGMTFTSIWDGKTYDDGMIPVGILPEGTQIAIPGTNADGSQKMYTVAAGGETYQSLYDRGLVDPQHSSSWTYWTNSWGNGTLNENWFKELNYIALREISISYRVPQSFAQKMKAKNINLTLTGRNLGYLLNSMPNGENPESVRGTVASEFRVRSFNGMTANYTFTINVGF
ncbi:MAG: SusC/RagA family TonB-linked outer membrane protein [Parabacteroides sp.]|nr:SusC/RagA family TonB-linked outer membrane protein [bacterium]MDY4101950.1 SusC/RagA family TonB-linked outer membrane protein [Parabacteroides sp.]